MIEKELHRSLVCFYVYQLFDTGQAFMTQFQLTIMSSNRCFDGKYYVIILICNKHWNEEK